MTPVTSLELAARWLADASKALSRARTHIAEALPVGLYAAQLDNHCEKLMAATAFLADEVALRRARAGRPPKSG